ncbi:MAG: hypothetical protein PHC64_00580 [Candidatus Gastranaerophilales bacterium]|nr:hypothetical protein [Candidatus Gastranaerophilales bacterium]
MKKHVYVKDTEGYAAKLPIEDLTDELTIISKKEYDFITGTKERLILSKWGGKRIGAGRPKLEKPKKPYSIKIDDEIIIYIQGYSKAKNISKNKAIQELLQIGINYLKQA